MMYRVIPSLPLVLLIAGCGMMTPPATEAPVAPPSAAPIVVHGNSAAALDTTTEAERAAATAAPAAAGKALGTVSVALGSPAEAGFWLKSPLVSAPGKGRVALPSGASVAVDLLPGAGGALLSLAAYRALGLGLTDLPMVTVTAD